MLFVVVKYILIIFLFPSAFFAAAQSMIIGSIVDEDEKPVGFCHVYNKTLDLGKVSDLNGKFEILARKNDTLRFSYVGYQPLELAITPVHLVNYLKITLPEDSILLPAITIYADPEYRVPLKEKSGDPIFIPGVSLVNPPPPVKPGDLRFSGNGVGGIPVPAIGIEGPITYFSRDEREKRKAAAAYEETRETITYQKYIAQDTIKQKLCDLYRINSDQYDRVIIRLHEQFPEIQKTYRPNEIWNWLLAHFDRTVPIIRDYR